MVGGLVFCHWQVVSSVSEDCSRLIHFLFLCLRHLTQGVLPRSAVELSDERRATGCEDARRPGKEGSKFACVVQTVSSRSERRFESPRLEKGWWTRRAWWERVMVSWEYEDSFRSSYQSSRWGDGGE